MSRTPLAPRIVVETLLPWLAVMAVLAAFLYLAAPKVATFLLFHPTRAPLGPPPTLGGVSGETVDTCAEDGIRLRHWWYDAGAGTPAVVVLHGNAGHLGHRTLLAEGLVERGISVLLTGYRGYGESEGRPSERGLYRDGASALALASSRAGGGDRTLLLGRSLGAAVAVGVAVREEVAGVVLDAPFTSLSDMARSLYPFLPSFMLGRLSGRFDTLQAIEELRAPVLVIHGTEDRLVPFSMGEAIYEGAPSPKEWFPIRGAGHNDVLLISGAAYFDVVADFVHRATGSEGTAPDLPDEDA